MSARTYSIVSPKGGAGKTITAVNLGRVLSGLGKKVLIIDADASTNGLSLFFLDELTKAKKQMKDAPTETDSLKKKALGSFETNERNPATPIYLANRFAIIPATYELVQTEHVEPDIFKKGLEETSSDLRDSFDYIFIDAQAGTDEFASISVGASDEVIIVSEYDPMSVQGIERMRILFHKEMAGKPTWILFNKMLPEFTSALGEFLSVAKYLTPIPWDADVIRAFVRRRSPIDMDQGNLLTMAVMQTAVSLLGDEISAQVEKWQSEKERFFKEPARERLEEIVKTIEELEEKKITKKYSKALFDRILKQIIWAIPIFIIFYVSMFLYFNFNKQYGSILEGIYSDEFWIIIGMVFGLGGASVALLPIVRAFIFRNREIQMEKEISILDKEIVELQEMREKYKTLLDSDVSSLIQKK